MKLKLTIGIMLVVIAALITILSITLVQQDSSDDRETILSRFDNKDIKRLDEFVQRHQNGNGDYLMLIPPIIDGGYWIHDVHSDGKEITWTIDNTRDGMSAERGKSVYTCKRISKQEESDFYVYTLDQCENQGDKSLPILRIPK